MKASEYLIYKLSDQMKASTKIDADLFKQKKVKRGLRNEDGTGVLVGLTNIGNVVGYERLEDGSLKPIEGRLYFRGYEISDIVNAIIEEKRFGFEEVAYLLLSGQLPDGEELKAFHNLVVENMPLEKNTLLHIIELEGHDIMNILSRSVLELDTVDEHPDRTSRENLMRQSIELMSKFPTIIAYAYNILLKTRICKIHTAVLHILNIRNQPAAARCIQSGNADTQDFGRLFSRNQFFHRCSPFLSRMWLWLSKSHECAGNRGCQRMVSDFEKKAVSTLRSAVANSKWVQLS